MDEFMLSSQKTPLNKNYYYLDYNYEETEAQRG